MVLLPGYPQKVVQEHNSRVARLSLACMLILVLSGGWWLTRQVLDDSNAVTTYGTVAVIFASALLLNDLVNFGPKERSRLSAAANISWPSILAFAGITYGPDDKAIATLMLALIAGFLWWFTNAQLVGSISTRRWRGMTSIAGLALALAVLVSLSDDLVLWAVVLAASCFTMIPDLLAKDDDHEARTEFGRLLEQTESRVLALREETSGMEQVSSLLKIAREEGWSDPERGMKMIAQAENEIERIAAFSGDLDAIRADALDAVERAESITVEATGPRKAFEMGDREADLGSFRDAELLYRRAKAKSETIEQHWQVAHDAIVAAESAISGHSGHQAEGVKEILKSAKQAMEAEDPVEALHIASSIPAHIESMGSTDEAAIKSLSDAEHAVAVAEGDIQIVTKDRLEQARKAMESGDSALAKGLADSVLRDVRATSEAMQEVQRALRQKKQIESRFPDASKQDWSDRLQQVAESANSGEWVSAAESLQSLTSDLQAHEHSISEASELVRFVEDEWKTLRSKLDSAGIGPSDASRMEAEKAVADAAAALSSGDIETCHAALASAGEHLESLGRLT